MLLVLYSRVEMLIFCKTIIVCPLINCAQFTFWVSSNIVRQMVRAARKLREFCQSVPGAGAPEGLRHPSFGISGGHPHGAVRPHAWPHQDNSGGKVGFRRPMEKFGGNPGMGK